MASVGRTPWARGTLGEDLNGWRRLTPELPNHFHEPWTEQDLDGVTPLRVATTQALTPQSTNRPVILTGPAPRYALKPIDMGFRNLVTPPADAVVELTRYTNDLLGKRLKILFRKSILPTQAINQMPGVDTWRFRWHSSPNGKVVKCRMVLIPAEEDASAAPAPAAYWTTTDQTPTSTQQASITTNSIVDAATTINPQDYFVATQTWSTIAGNTTYEAVLTVTERWRCISATVWEVPPMAFQTGIDTILNPTQAYRGGPIYDAHVADVFDAGNKLFKYQGAHLFNWSENAATGIASTATSYTNIFDASSTAWSDVTPGFHVPSAYRGSINDYSATTGRESLGAVLYAWLSISDAAETCSLRFLDQTGTIGTLTRTGSTATVLVRTTVTWSAQSDSKIDLHILTSNVAATATVYAAGAFLYEA